MKACLVMIVRDDEDILAYTLQHYYMLGIKKMYIMNNIPTKAVQDILDLAEATYEDLMIERFYNSEPILIQEKEMKGLTDQALLDGYEWIIGSDADEILVLNKPLNSFLDGYELGTSLVFRWRHNVVDGYPMGNPYDYAIHKGFMDEIDSRWTKSIGRFTKYMGYTVGQHEIEACDNTVFITDDIGVYEHLPYRTKEQKKKKDRIWQKVFDKRFDGYIKKTDFFTE